MGISESNQNCVNFGTVCGTSDVGGVYGYSDHAVINCANYGTVSGLGNNVGGVCGAYGTGRITNCYNSANITGKNHVGGIIGNIRSCSTTNCYNIGTILCTETGNNAGAILGTDGAVWGKDTVADCYYLITDGLYGCGGVSSSSMEPEGFYAKTSDELKQQTTFENWDFGETWRINEKYNDGYPYLAWEHADDAPPLENIINEYKLGNLIVRDMEGAALTAIPSGSFLVTIPITKLVEGGDCLIFLASYTASGRYKGMMYVSAKDIPVGSTVEITLPVDNARGEVTLLKAFCVASFGNLTPLGVATVFPAQ